MSCSWGAPSSAAPTGLRTTLRTSTSRRARHMLNTPDAPESDRLVAQAGVKQGWHPPARVVASALDQRLLRVPDSVTVQAGDDRTRSVLRQAGCDHARPGGC